MLIETFQGLTINYWLTRPLNPCLPVQLLALWQHGFWLGPVNGKLKFQCCPSALVTSSFLGSVQAVVVDLYSLWRITFFEMNLPIHLHLPSEALLCVSPWMEVWLGVIEPCSSFKFETPYYLRPLWLFQIQLFSIGKDISVPEAFQLFNFPSEMMPFP